MLDWYIVSSEKHGGRKRIVQVKDKYTNNGKGYYLCIEPLTNKVFHMPCIRTEYMSSKLKKAVKYLHTKRYGKRGKRK